MAKAKEERETQAQTPQSEQSAMQTTGERGRNQQSGIARREQFAPSLWGTSPFAFMRRFSEEMDRLFEDFGLSRSNLFGPSTGRGLSGLGEMSRSMWSPQVEVFQRGDQLIVRADLPGMNREDVNVDIDDDSLTIRGERRQEREENEEGFYRSERSYGSFFRQIPLPEGVNAENAQASFRDGVLEITMQAPQQKPRGRRLEIREGSETRTTGQAKAASK